MFKWCVSQELVPVIVHQALTTLPGLRRGRSAERDGTGSARALDLGSHVNGLRFHMQMAYAALAGESTGAAAPHEQAVSGTLQRRPLRTPVTAWRLRRAIL